MSSDAKLKRMRRAQTDAWEEVTFETAAEAPISFVSAAAATA